VYFVFFIPVIVMTPFWSITVSSEELSTITKESIPVNGFGVIENSAPERDAPSLVIVIIVID